jgi:hypothetical protein
MTAPRDDEQAREDERAVTSEPVDMEDGSTVTVQQQNAGPGSQLGGGEFKRAEREPSPEKIALEQLQLEEDAPVDGD